MAHVLCFFGRINESWVEVLKALRSKDYLVRVRTANMIAYEQPVFLREEIIVALKEALAVEEPLAVREAFERCLSILTTAQNKREVRRASRK